MNQIEIDIVEPESIESFLQTHRHSFFRVIRVPNLAYDVEIFPFEFAVRLFDRLTDGLSDKLFIVVEIGYQKLNTQIKINTARGS